MGKEGIDPKRFDEYAAKIAAIPDDAEKIAAAMDLWGKSGAELIPMLANLQKFRQEARKLGLVPTQEAIELATKLGDELDKLTSVFSMAMFNVGAALAPVLIPVVESVVQIVGSVSKWVQKSGEMVRTIAAIGIGLTVVGGLVLGIGAGLVILGSVLGAITTIVSIATAVAGAVLTPVGLVVAGIVAIGAGYWLLFTESSQRCAKALVMYFKPFFQFMQAGLQGIFDALAGGNFAVAAGIAALGMQIAFKAAIRDIVANINLIPNAMLDAMQIVAKFNPAVDGMVKDAKEALANLVVPEDELKGMRTAYDAMLNAAAKARENAGSPSDGSPIDGEELKSFGSFNPVALEMQNWGGEGCSGLPTRSGQIVAKTSARAVQFVASHKMGSVWEVLTYSSGFEGPRCSRVASAG